MEVPALWWHHTWISCRLLHLSKHPLNAEISPHVHTLNPFLSHSARDEQHLAMFATDTIERPQINYPGMFIDLISWPVAKLGALSVLLIAALWVRLTTRRGTTFVTHNKRGDVKGVPLTFPCIFPLLGSLPIIYLWKPREFVSDPK